MVVQRPKGSDDPTTWRRRTLEGRAAPTVPVMSRLPREDHADLLRAVHARGAKNLASLMRQIIHDWIEAEVRSKP